jgi:YHS domain-containing protein
MIQVKDPVCEMMVDPETAAAHTIYESHEVYFCSQTCRRDFEKEPARYAHNLEQQNPGLMDTKSFHALKFGSAASGGLEYGPAQERHDRE